MTERTPGGRRGLVHAGLGAGLVLAAATASAQPARTTAASLASRPRRENIVPPDMQNIYDRFHYAPAVRIGDVLYVSGQVGRDEALKVVEDPEAQMAQAWKNVEKVLTFAGLGFEDVFQLETWFTDFRKHLPTFLKVKDRFVTTNYPTWTGFGVSEFSTPGIMCEIKVTAMYP